LEAKYCHYLGLLTEEQKRTQAIVTTSRAAEVSADAAKESANHAGEAIKMAKDSESFGRRVAMISAAAAVASAVIALIVLFLKK
jgi:hypothetical protein